MEEIVRRFAMEMNLPEDKRAGYYAQIIKGLAGKSPVADRDKDLLIFADAPARDLAVPVMEQYRVPYEEMDLLQLPPLVNLHPEFSDYGLISRLEKAYLYAEQVCVFRLRPDAPGSGNGRPPEPAQAAQQLREHLLADWQGSDGTAAVYAMQAPQAELAEGIARAYSCSVEWLHRPD